MSTKILSLPPRGDDPAFAAISAHRKAVEAYNLSDDDGGPLFEATERALNNLAKAPFTTLAGCVALLRYMEELTTEDPSIATSMSAYFFGTLADAIERMDA